MSKYKVTYHRNAPSGDSFWTVEFKNGSLRMIAIATSEDVETPLKNIACMVISPDNPSTIWRGEDFKDRVLWAINETQTKG